MNKKFLVIALIGCILLSGCTNVLTCKHEYKEIARTYAEPQRIDTQSIRGSANDVNSYFVTIQRICLGTTSIVYRCDKCGLEYTIVTLGKDINCKESRDAQSK
jgi:uncharacterized protein YceK